MNRSYIIKILEQDIKKTPDGVFYSLAEPLKFSGSGDKLVPIVQGNFSDDVMLALRRDVITKFGDELVSFTLERIPNIDCSTKPPRAKTNQMDPTESHCFTVQGKLAAIFDYMRGALLKRPNAFLTPYIVTISP